MQRKDAPGAPGVKANWTSAAKDGVGKALSANSSVSFTIGDGILNEIYYPREDVACVKDMEFIVTDGENFFSEEKRNTQHRIKTVKPGVPLYQIVNTCIDKKYQIKKEILCDPFRQTVLQNITFTKAKNVKNLNLYALLSPHLNDKGDNNSGWIGEYKGVQMLFAKSDGLFLAMACSAKWLKRSVGFACVSDGWTDLHQHKKMEWQYTHADNGNITLTAEIDISSTNNFLLAISFGTNPDEAANHAVASMLDGFESAKKFYIKSWQVWLKELHNLKGKILKESASVLRVNEAKSFPGGIIASSSTPWGEIKGDDENAGYHVIWPRDLVESAGGFLALKTHDDVLRVLNYLISTQESDGSWLQNMWLEGTPHWQGIQLDQTALPLLLIDKCRTFKIFDKERMRRYWPAVKNAISYLIINGPYTQEDRWERNKGYTAFTLAAEIAALLAAAGIAEENNEKDLATYCRETADCWSDNIENWIYATGTSLAKKYNVDGYYIRINPYIDVPAEQLKDKYIHIANRDKEDGRMLVNEVICVDALALVRFGLRAPDDEKILNTIKLIDATLKVETPFGSCWHRYTKDGYGEDEHGNPYDGKGIGRAWPLLTGERAHYEIAAGNFNEAKKLMRAMEAFANNGLLPEQIWDTDDIPDKKLFFGRPSGSAMPLTWAHAEYIKLCASVKEKKVFDMPHQTQERYIKQKTSAIFEVWRFEDQRKTISSKKTLRIEIMEDAIVHWTQDNWKTKYQTRTKDTGINIFVADISAQNKKASKIEFTFFWVKANRWENKNFAVVLE
ncbi:MAG TPA: glycoside hydrolase family 15 protein [Parafilimonas sp.]|nr:glycoside hydrolase family 15 protein [Parafilimonas sp.]